MISSSKLSRVLLNYSYLHAFVVRQLILSIFLGSVNVSSSYVSSAGESIPSQPVIKPNVDRAAYDEFEADLNGCGLVIRVLKNAHKVSAVGRPSHPTAGTFTKPEVKQDLYVKEFPLNETFFPRIPLIRNLLLQDYFRLFATYFKV